MKIHLHILKESSNRKIRGLKLYKNEKKIIENVEKDFVEKELLALMGIETNYGKYLGKMDITLQ